MKEKLKMTAEHYQFSYDSPINKNFDYRNLLYTRLVHHLIDKSFEFCKKLPTEEKLEKLANKNLDDLWKDDQEWFGLIANGQIQIEKLIYDFFEEIMDDVPMDFDIEEDEEKWNKMKQDRISNLIHRLVILEKKINKK